MKEIAETRELGQKMYRMQGLLRLFVVNAVVGVVVSEVIEVAVGEVVVGSLIDL